jgi:predicted transcriptional regulator
MLRPVDIAVLLKLTLQGAEEMSFQQLASDLRLSASEVHGSCKRSTISSLLNQGVCKKVNRTALRTC